MSTKVNKNAKNMMRTLESQTRAMDSLPIETENVFKGMSLFEQEFVLQFAIGKTAKEAYRKARVKTGLPMHIKTPILEREAKFMLMKKNVSKAIDELKRAKSKALGLDMAIHAQEMQNAFITLSDRSGDLKEINEEIAKVDKMLDFYITMGDEKSVKAMMSAKSSLFSTREKVKSSLPKNIQTAHNIVNASQEKTVVYAQAINVNVGKSEEDKPEEEEKVDKGEVLDATPVTEDTIHDL